MGRDKLFSREQVLEAIQQWIRRSGYPPTIDELRRAMGVGSTRTIMRYLEWLEQEGDIRRWPGARGLQLTRSLTNSTHTIAVPIVGEAAAGTPITATQNIEGWLRLPKERVKPATAKHFLLRVRGDSMNRAELSGETIENNDLVLVRQQSEARAGEVVVALIDGEATIKRLSKGPGYFALKPESSNADHQPILLSDQFSVQGVVQSVIKRGADVFSSYLDG